MSIEISQPNPYTLAPVTPEDLTRHNEAARRRQELYGWEARITALGWCCLGAFAFALAIVVKLLTVALAAGVSTDLGAAALLGAAISLPIAILSYQVGMGLRRFDSKIRTRAFVLALIWLVWFPLGTFFGVYVIALMRSTKTASVMSEEHQTVLSMTKTPDTERPLAALTLIATGVLFAMTTLVVLLVG